MPRASVVLASIPIIIQLCHHYPRDFKTISEEHFYLVTDRNWNKYDSCGLLLIYMTKSLYRMHINYLMVTHTLLSRMNIKSSPPALPSRFEMLKPRTSNLRMCQKASATEFSTFSRYKYFHQSQNSFEISTSEAILWFVK